VKTFLEYFINKIDALTACVIPSGLILDYVTPPSLVHYLSEFKPVSFPNLVDLVCQMKPTHCSLDIVPPRLLVDVLDMVGLDLFFCQ